MIATICSSSQPRNRIDSNTRARLRTAHVYIVSTSPYPASTPPLSREQPPSEIRSKAVNAINPELFDASAITLTKWARRRLPAHPAASGRLRQRPRAWTRHHRTTKLSQGGGHPAYQYIVTTTWTPTTTPPAAGSPKHPSTPKSNLLRPPTKSRPAIGGSGNRATPACIRTADACKTFLSVSLHFHLLPPPIPRSPLLPPPRASRPWLTRHAETLAAT